MNKRFFLKKEKASDDLSVSEESPRTKKIWDKVYKILIILLFAATMSGVAILGILNVGDLWEQKRAEATLQDLKGLRIALEKYYRVAKQYPDLSKEGACNDLKMLDYYDDNGKLISFAEIYGKNEISATPENDKVNSTNQVYDISKFKEGTFGGGWNYDYTGKTGEIHANLPFNVFSQEVEWDEY